VRKSFGDVVAVDGVDLEIDHGEFFSLLGPSGSGKTTLLRIIAGFERPDDGTVWLADVDVTNKAPFDRNVNTVFQDYALFPHMTISENVEYGLKVKGVAKQERRSRAEEALQMVRLPGYGKRKPSQLSGGQRQRVALARAIAPRPRLLLLDEPFGAVDAKVRDELRRWLRGLHDELHTTSIFVTHDQEEAFAVADRVFIVARGRLEQVGTPVEILEEPATEFVARFIGEANVFDGHVAGGRAWVGPIPMAQTGLPDGPARLVIRSYDLKFWRDDVGPALVERVLPLGDRVRVEARIDGGLPIFAHFPRRSSLLRGVAPGKRVAVQVTHSRAFPSDGA
jgi:ABC-type Fe3+/spermidine/putrescine transport system ATPase subunit